MEKTSNCLELVLPRDWSDEKCLEICNLFPDGMRASFLHDGHQYVSIYLPVGEAPAGSAFKLRAVLTEKIEAWR